MFKKSIIFIIFALFVSSLAFAQQSSGNNENKGADRNEKQIYNGDRDAYPEKKAIPKYSTPVPKKAQKCICTSRSDDHCYSKSLGVTAFQTCIRTAPCKRTTCDK